MESEERFDSIGNGSGSFFVDFSKNRSKRFVSSEHAERYKFAIAYTRDKVVLDMACGSGYGSNYIAQKGAQRVVGADKEQEAVEEAKKRYQQTSNVEYRTMDAERIDFPNESFDMVVSFETIEHIERPEVFLAKLKNVVKKGGVCIFSTPNRNISNPGTSLSDKPVNPFHVREYVLDEFLDLLKKYFVVEDIYGQGVYTKTTNPLCKKYMGLRQFLLTLTRSGVRIATRVHPLQETSEPTYMVVVCKNSL